MSIESWTASLHTGLIKRSRPPASAKVVPLREHAAFGRAQATPLRESALARALGSLGRSPETDDAQLLERALAAPRAGTAAAQARDGWSFRHRFGLTVRVHAGLRELLFDARSRTGRTTQSILHDALVHYLRRLDREPDQR